MELVQRFDIVSPRSLITVPEVPPTSQKAHDLKLTDALEQYKHLFDGLGCLPGKYKIKLKPETVPVSIIHPPPKEPVAI